MEKKSELEISDQSDEVSVSLKSTGKGVRKRDPIKCPQCSKMFTKPSNLKIHMCMHTGEPLPKSFQCNVCATMFLDKSVLKRHLSSHVEKSHEHHECVKCNKEYTQLADLREHELEQHGKVIMEDQPPEEIEIKCEIIEISDGDVNLGPNSKAKRKRVKKKPDPSKRVQCDRCPKHFESNYLLNRHVRLAHLGERPHMCVGCGKTYTQLGHLRTHELKHNGVKNFNCTECDAAFYRKVELGMHQKIHTGEKNYTCELCPKSFVQKGNLVMHVKTHVGDRRFQCDVCNKMFITNSKLKQHYKRHTKEKTEKGRTFVMMPDDDSIISDTRDE